MIDFVKIIFLSIDVQRLVELPYLHFESKVDETTGEIIKREAIHHYCRIIVLKSNTVMFRGSLHKLYNSLHNITEPNYYKKSSNGFNGNQFNINQLFEVRNHLEQLFNCNADQMILQNLEYGINTTPLFNPQLFINGLLYHRGIPFDFQFKRNFAEVTHSRYYFKIYSKSNQYGMEKDTLRIELKLMKSIEFRPIGLTTLADLNETSLNNLKQLLLRRFSEVVYYDNTTRQNALKRKEKDQLSQFQNIDFWLNIESNKRYRPKNKLNWYINNFSENLKSQLTVELKEKCIIINTLYKQLDVIKRVCPVTGVDISNQKQGSTLLSNTGLKILEANEPLMFNFLKNALLTGNYNKYENTIYDMMSKQIRNKYYNNPDKYNVPSLFQSYEYEKNYVIRS